MATSPQMWSSRCTCDEQVNVEIPEGVGGGIHILISSLAQWTNLNYKDDIL